LVPAICSPEYFDIISFKIPDEARRGMLYLGKILQIIATEVQGTKETYMDCMNKLVLEYREVIQYWFDQLAKLPPSNSPQNIYDLNITNEEYQTALQLIATQIGVNIDKMLEYIDKYKEVFESCETKGAVIESLEKIMNCF